MSRSRRFFEPADDRAYRGPSDEMLAVDAATELRSMTLLYERWADRIYRYFLLCTGDQVVAERMMRDLIKRLPGDLQKFAGQDRSFAGWLFGRASEVFWQEYSVPSRVYRRVSRYVPGRRSNDGPIDQSSGGSAPVLAGFEEMAGALRILSPDKREVLGIHLGAQLKTAPAAEALRLPASLMSSHVQWALDALAEQVDVTNTRRLSQDLSDLINHQTFNSQQRQSHFSLLHGVFLGEVEMEPDEDQQRAPVFEVAALIGVVSLGLFGIWIWGLITPGDQREHEVATPPTETAAQPDPTATPTVEMEPTPEATPDEMMMEPANDEIRSCMATEGKAQFDRFVRMFNEGDFEGLRMMLPDDDEASEEVTSDDETVPSGGIDAHFVHGENDLEDPGDIIEFLEARYDAGERWDVLEAYPAEHYRNWRGAAPLEMYQDWKREHPDMSMIIIGGLDWSADEQEPEIAQGRVIIDCDPGLVLVWDLQVYGDQNPDPVSLTDYIAAMEPLEPGEFRHVRAWTWADSRPDGGLLSSWEIIWSEAALNDAKVERIDVQSLEGTPIISFVHDGSRWSLVQRGWFMYGSGDDPPLPDEIVLPMPWLRQLPGLIQEFEVDPNSIGGTSLTLTEDYSYTAIGGIERFLDINLIDGNLGAITLRERAPSGERVRPEIRILSVNRGDEPPDDYFHVASEPEFPELDVEATRYQVPADEHGELRLLHMTVGGDQTEETYRLSWNDVEFDLTARPSRGGLDVQSIPSSLDESWTTAATEYRWGSLVWAYRQFAGYPTDAVWDDGRFRFELSVDRDAITPEHDWSLQELIALANALSVDAFEGLDVDEPVTVGGGGNGSARSATARDAYYLF
jgi:DNA-directed RNA polymerase specialized sigma24 family protein